MRMRQSKFHFKLNWCPLTYREGKYYHVWLKTRMTTSITIITRHPGSGIKMIRTSKTLRLCSFIYNDNSHDPTMTVQIIYPLRRAEL